MHGAVLHRNDADKREHLQCDEYVHEQWDDELLAVYLRRDGMQTVLYDILGLRDYALLFVNDVPTKETRRCAMRAQRRMHQRYVQHGLAEV